MKRILTACLLFCAQEQSWANQHAADTNNPRVYLGAAAGVIFPSIRTNNSVGTGAGWPNDNYVSRSIENNTSFLFDAGYLWSRSAYWFPYYSLGLRYQYISPMTTKGYIDQYSLAGFRNYNYKYDIQFLNVLATLKADIFRWKNVMPYVLAAAGVSNFNTSNYQESATPNVTPRVSPGFGSYSGTNFLYNLGLGLDYVFSDDLWFNLEYNYSDYRRIQTGNGANTSTLTGTNYSNEFIKNDLKASALFFGVTYYVK